MKDVTILMDTKLGRPADMLEEAVAERLEVVAACLFPRLDGRVAHLAVADDDVETVRQVAIAHAATVADVRDCVVVPQSYGKGVAAVARTVADAGITVFIAYFGPSGDLILSTSNPDATAAVLGINTQGLRP